ncbi:MFS transporter [Actinoallomurus sp. NPDC052274]|uniref:MFS transporter n=1 Tax=Actinoallomurus sp. NPDC052274 TaxID=3155420 RepID=UPI003417530A
MVGALPLGMLSLGLLLFLRTWTGSLADAGLGIGVFGVGNAVGLSFQGRLIDRAGQTTVLVSAGLACAAWIGVLVTIAPATGSMALALVASAGAGSTFPATTGSMRVLLAELVAEAEDRTAGYALLAMLFQLALLTGPLATSLLLTPVGPGGAVLVAGGLAGAAGVLFAATGASRAWRPHPQAARTVTPAVRTHRTLLPLLVIATGAGISAGLISVAVPAAALSHAAAGDSGQLLAMSSAGEIVGGFAFGARRWRCSATRQLLATLAGAMVAACLTASVSGRLTWLFAAMLLTGACTGPFAVASSDLLDTVTPKAALTQSYTLMVGIGLLGVSLGSSAGGAIVDAAGYQMAFTINACWLGCLLVIGVLIHPALARQPPEPTSVIQEDHRRR